MQAAFIEVAEIAPAQHRGAFISLNNVGRAAGAWCFAMIQYAMTSPAFPVDWGWRFVLLFPIWPAAVMLFLLPWIPESPNSLIQRGELERGRRALQRIRGPLYRVDKEFDEILAAAGVGSKVSMCSH